MAQLKTRYGQYEVFPRNRSKMYFPHGRLFVSQRIDSAHDTTAIGLFISNLLPQPVNFATDHQ
jgi:hypothetical protein